MSKKVIIFTGGGSGGHVVPALTLIEELRRKGEWQILYVGSKKGIERNWARKLEIDYHFVSTGKLRRYWSYENVLDIFRLLWGVVQSLALLWRFDRRRTLVFSMGGFVSLPVIVAAWLQKKKIYLHEQTSCAGLANRMGALLADRVFVTFESSKKFFPSQKVVVSGYPLRRECFDQKVRSTIFGGIDLKEVNRPILFITGGGNGSRLLNEKVQESLPQLTEKYFVLHQVGQSFEKEYRELQSENYLPTGLVEEGILDLYKMAKVVLSRAGAGVVCELIALGKKSIFVPLAMAQKNEQYHNAQEARQKLGSWVVEEKDFLQRDLVALLGKFEAEEGQERGQGQENGLEFLANEVEKSMEQPQ